MVGVRVCTFKTGVEREFSVSTCVDVVNGLHHRTSDLQTLIMQLAQG